ncbi:type VII secretion target [Glycomyces sp. NPDC046736]|uniref:type VII secretion target n=1 Tax=Glycomyces sp. NPDC046736 TaxID=3155615 RepID=UPI0033C6CB37
MSTPISVDPAQLRSASSDLAGQAPDAERLPDDLEREARQASRSNNGFMTASAVESFAEEAKGVMVHYREHLDFESEAIGACADAWEAVDEEAGSKFDDIGSELATFTVPRIAGGA